MRALSVPALALMALELPLGLVRVVIACPVAVVVTEVAESVPTSVENDTTTPAIATPPAFCTLAASVAWPWLAPVPDTAPRFKLKGTVSAIGGVGVGASGA